MKPNFCYNGLMDIEKLTHRNYRMNVLVAVILSGVVVTAASLLGRGVLQIKGALLTDKPTDLTVAILLEPYDLVPRDVYELPKREDKNFHYSVETQSGAIYFLTIDKNGPPWKLKSKPEKLHASGRL